MTEALMESAYGRIYRDLYERHWWWRSREALVLRWVRRLAGAGGGRREDLKILDIGCGDGLMWPRLEELGQVEGIEPDGRLVSRGSPWSPRIEIASFPAGRERRTRFDVVLLLDVLEHIKDDGAALARARSLLAGGGHLILTVPAMPALWSDFDVLNGHQRRYTRRTLATALRTAGFEIVRLRHYFCWTVLPLLARRLFFRAAHAETSRFLSVPPAPINRLLRLISNAEHRLTQLLPMPLGSSLFAVARKGA